MFARAITIVLAALVGACGPSPQAAPGWNTSMSHVFSNDSVEPDRLPRQYWTADDEELLLKRMGFADTVVVGTVRVVSQLAQGGVARRLTLAFQPREVLYGSVEGQVDSDGELTLQPEPGTDEFRRALRAQKSLPGTRYLLFLKRRGAGESRWALYQPSAGLLADVRGRYAALKRHQDGGVPRDS